MSENTDLQCRQCGQALREGARYCGSCGTEVAGNGRIDNEQSERHGAAARLANSVPPLTPETAPLRHTLGRPSDRRRTAVFAMLVSGAVLLLAALLLGVIGVERLKTPDPPPRSSAWQKITSELLLDRTIHPSDETQVIDAGESIKIVLSGGFLDSPQRLTVAALSGGPELEYPLPVDSLGVYEVTLGSARMFSSPLLIDIAYDAEQLDTSIPPEFALAASYWDEAVDGWVEMPSFVDTERKRLVIPTLHLTKIHIYMHSETTAYVYDDAGYFCVLYDTQEYNDMFIRQFESAMLSRGAAAQRARQVMRTYAEEVLTVLNEARIAYQLHGFRELEQIKAVEEQVQIVYENIGPVSPIPVSVTGSDYPSAPPGGDLRVPIKKKSVTLRHNVILKGAVPDSSTRRSKLTGIITLPYSHEGANRTDLAHELFHSIQNRYYNMVGMTELGVPMTTSPAATLLARIWWMEATAEYAAFRVAFPNARDAEPTNYWDMGGSGLEMRRLEKPLTHSPSVVRDSLNQYMLGRESDSARPAYHNAWFIEFLVKEKGINFREMFEEVASYKWPSVYDNLVSYLKTKNLDIAQVYSEYARWWYFDPASPLNRGVAPTQGMPSTSAFTERYLKHSERDLTDWRFAHGDPHCTRMWEVRVQEDPARPRWPRTLIVSLDPEVPRFHKEEKGQPLWSDPPRRSLWVHSPAQGGSPASTRELTAKDPKQVVIFHEPGALALLAVRNDRVLDPGPRVDYVRAQVAEVHLKLDPAEIMGMSPNNRYTFTATATRIPEDLTRRLHFEWLINDTPYHSTLPGMLKNLGGIIVDSLKDRQIKQLDKVTVRLYQDGKTLLAETEASRVDEHDPCQAKTFQALVTSEPDGTGRKIREYGFVLMTKEQMVSHTATAKGSLLTPEEIDGFTADILKLTVLNEDDYYAYRRVLPAQCLSRIESRELLVMLHETYTKYGHDGKVLFQAEYDRGQQVRVIQRDDTPPVGTNPFSQSAKAGSGDTVRSTVQHEAPEFRCGLLNNRIQLEQNAIRELDVLRRIEVKRGGQERVAKIDEEIATRKARLAEDQARQEAAKTRGFCDVTDCTICQLRQACAACRSTAWMCKECEEKIRPQDK